MVYSPAVHPACPPRGRRGFTLIEMLVTVAVLALVVSLAVPSLQAFVQRNTTASIANDFSAGVAQARMEAISKNVCVTMCQTANPTASSPTCASSGDDWQRGWLIFLNPTCTAGAAPGGNNQLVKIRNPDESSYLMDNSGVYELLFDGRGLPSQGMSTRLIRNPEGTNFKYARTLCLSLSGRVSVRAYNSGGTCS